MKSKFPISIHVAIDAITLWWDNWYLMLAISWLCLLSWLTIIFGPPVTFTAYWIIKEVIYDELPGWRRILQAGKRYLLLSWGWMLGNLIIGMLLIANQMFYGQIENRWASFFQLVSIAFMLLWSAIQFYALPYLMLQEHKNLFLAWRNGLYSVLGFPIYTLSMLILSTLITAVSIGMVLPVLFGLPAFLVILSSLAVKERMETYRIHERDPVKSERRYEEK